MFIKNCQNCTTQFSKPKNCSIKDWDFRKFCSVKCFHQFKQDEINCAFCNKFFIRPKNRTGKYCSSSCSNKVGYWKNKKRYPETIKKISESKIGSVPWNKGKTGFISPKKGIENPSIRGEKHWNWQGGKTPLSISVRMSVQYNEWRKSVYARDNWTCQICNIKQKHPVAHHLLSFSEYPDKRFEINNGQTLCRSCHKKVHYEIGKETRFRSKLQDNLRFA